MIDREVPTRPHRAHRRRQKNAVQKRRRRIFVLLVAAIPAWFLLGWFGVTGLWRMGLSLAVAGLLLLLAYSRPAARPRRRRVVSSSGRDAEPTPSPARVLSEEYNTLTPSPAPRVVPMKPQEPRPSPAAAKQLAAPEPKRQMPPPVPPPLFGRPGLRPVLAGHTPTPAEPTPAQPPPVEPTPAQPPPAEPTPAEPPPAEPTPAEPTPAEPPPAEPTPAEPPPAEPTPAEPPPAEPVPAEPRRPAPRPAIGLPAPATGYVLPPLHMLPPPKATRGISDDEILERAALLEHTLKTFGVEAKVIDFAFGPAVTRYELQPGPGVRVNKFTALSDDLALALAAEDIRIEAPIPGKSAVGIEVPNKERLAVPLREVLESPAFRTNPSKLAVAFGKDNAGNPVVGDLARMPHLLIAGSTGSGKSVCMNTIISSLLFKAQPHEVKMLMIDPKMVELSTYNGIPHLMAPVITDVKKAAGFLKGAVKEMEARYELFAGMGVRNIQHYNQVVASDPGPDPENPRRPLPFIVIFIDELADLMMVAPADVEDSICRLAQMARACGMHLVIATQSPRVDVITGLIKANVPSRIAFAVSSGIDSRVIMDSAGAERLLGRGDMLYHPSGSSKPLRAQGAYIDEASVEELVRFVKAQGRPVFTAQEVAVETGSKRRGASEEPSPSSAADAAFPQAVRVVIEHGQASVSIIQRRLRCNYAKATRLIDMMEERGFIGPHQGSRPRDVLISLAQWQAEFGEMETTESTDEPPLD